MNNEYLKNLPRKRMGVGALILNEKDEILIVKPHYKEHWSIAGGVIDENESPRVACIREVEEEIGLKLKEVKFLCVDYTRANKDKDESLQFIFFGGKITDKESKSIKIDNKEIIEYRFASLEQALELLGGFNRSLVKRLPKCLDALKNNTTFYLEDGK